MMLAIEAGVVWLRGADGGVRLRLKLSQACS